MKKLLLVLFCLFASTMFLHPAYAELPKNSDNEYESPDFFNPNDKYEPPYEIYIPNELDSYKNIHTNYRDNTDTCASCHTTHTAVGGALLQWKSVSETCMACHNGTVSTTYDVVSGRFLDYRAGEFYPNSAGHFSNDRDDPNASLHNVSELVSISAAPGGSEKGVDAMLRRKGQSGYAQNSPIIAWDVPFTCASCHNPHGAGGNARLLQQDPNGFAQRYPLRKAQMYTTDDETGTRVLWSVFPDVDGNGNRDMTWRGTTVKPYTLITSYPYIRDTNVYRRAKDSPSAPYELITNYTVDNSSGATVFKFTSDPSKKDGVSNYYNIYVDGLPGVRVGVRIKNYLEVGEYVEYKYGINLFCATCHEDYNTATKQFFRAEEENSRYFGQYPNQLGYYSGSGGKKAEVEGGNHMSGIYSKAYRHQVGMSWDKLTPGLRFERDPWEPDVSILDKTRGRFIVNCLTCHVAHGVSRDYWNRTIGERAGSTHPDADFPNGLFSYDELQELAPPSALKRMPNMGVCEACHRKGDEAVQYTVNVEKD